MNKVLVIEEKLKTIDVSKLAVYSNKISDIGSMNRMMAPTYMQDFIIAYDVTNTLLSNIIKYDVEVSSQLKQAESIAYLDRAGDYLTSKGIKDTADARKRYVEIDDDVIKAREIKAKTEAMCVFLKNKLRSFQDAQHAVKKIAYGDEFMTPEEGFRNG